MIGGAREATISGPRVWVVSADQWPRAYLRAELIERGYDATGFLTITDAVVRLRLARSVRPALLVFDRHGQAVDEKSRALLFQEGIPVLAVADAGRPDDEPAGPIVETLHRPLTIGAIADAVDSLMGRRAVRSSSPYPMNDCRAPGESGGARSSGTLRPTIGRHRLKGGAA